MATYKLRFAESARKEWNKLAHDLRRQFETVLARRLQEPRIPSAALHGMRDCYKIKLRDAGYRLVYRVEDAVVTVTVIAIGKRDKDSYGTAERRQ